MTEKDTRRAGDDAEPETPDALDEDSLGDEDSFADEDSLADEDSTPEETAPPQTTSEAKTPAAPPSPDAPAGDSADERGRRVVIARARAALTVVISLIALTALNVALHRTHARVDMTAKRIYTLDPISARAASKSKHPIKAVAYISPDLPAPLHRLEQLLDDTLAEYATRSRGNLSYRIVRVEDGSEQEREAIASGCKKNAIGTETASQVSLRAVFKCVIFTTRGEKPAGEKDTKDEPVRKEIVPDLNLVGVPELDRLESVITLALLNLQSQKARKLGFLTGFGGPVGQDGGVNALKPAFKQLYGNLLEPVPVNLDVEKPFIPDDVSALVIVETTLPLTPEAIFHLDQFVQRGGNIAWYQSGTTIDAQLTMLRYKKEAESGQGKPIIPFLKTPRLQLAELFASWGIQHNRDLLVDPKHAMTGMAQTQMGNVVLTHPATFQMNELDRSLPWLANMPPIAFPMPSSVSFTERADKNKNIKKFKLFQTDPSAMRMTRKPKELTYEAFQTREGLGRPQRYMVGAAIQGKLPSHYDEHALPKGKAEVDLYRGERKTARVMVWGSGAFLERLDALGYNQQLAQLNQGLFLGSLDWIAQDNALTGMRNKSLPRLIGKVPDALRRPIQFINIAGVPAALVLLGYIMLVRRRLRRKALDGELEGDAMDPPSGAGGPDGGDDE